MVAIAISINGSYSISINGIAISISINGIAIAISINGSYSYIN